MGLTLIGLSHVTAPIEVRERLTFRDRDVPSALAAVLADGGVSEAALLSTCNRSEFYVHLTSESGLAEAVRLLEAKGGGELPQSVVSYLYHRRDLDAVRHLYRVTAGLDSMIVGEAQIQGQVKEAYESARTVIAGGRPAIGPALHRLFQSAFAAAGRVRAQTRLGEGAASVPSAAVELARKIFGSLRGRRAMVVGGGEMGELSMRCLAEEGVQIAFVVSRRRARAQELAHAYGAQPIAYPDFWRSVPSVDVALFSSGAPHAVLTREHMREAFPQGVHRPLCVIDIAVPRDVEPVVGELPNVFLYNVDDLQQIASANLERRRAEIPRAERFLEEAAQEFWRWYLSLQAVPLIRELRARAEALRRQEVDRLLRELSHLSPEDRLQVDRVTQRLLHKLLHGPTVRLREAAEGNGHAGVLDAARFLFDVQLRDGAPE